MSCFKPFTAFDTGGKTDAGKKQYFISFGNLSRVSLDQVERSHIDYNISKFQFVDGRFWLVDPIKIPCGNCIGCRLEYSRQWATRCVLEAQQFDFNYFVTLTYDDKYLPEDMNVSKRVVQLFMKRLRKYMGALGYDNIRFFGCGEYGSINGRPHYHLILFNCPLPHLVPYKDNLFICEDLYKLWPYGFHTVGACTFESCGYVARYCMKKTGKTKGRTPEFTLMSRKPGIGSNYFTINYDKIYKFDTLYLPRYGSSLKVRPP